MKLLGAGRYALKPPRLTFSAMYYVVCSWCSYVLHASEKPVDVLKVLSRYGDKCPRCLHRLSLEPKRIVIKARKK